MATTPPLSPTSTPAEIRDQGFAVDDDTLLEVAIFLSLRQYSSLDEERSRLESRVRSRGLELIPVSGDGNCLFRSLGFHLGRRHEDVRADVVGWLRLNGNYNISENTPLSSFVESASWVDYCAHMALPATWADHVTLVAAAVFYLRDIVIISSVAGDRYVTRIKSHCPFTSDYHQSFLLGHWHERHYQPLAVAAEPTTNRAPPDHLFDEEDNLTSGESSASQTPTQSINSLPPSSSQSSSDIVLDNLRLRDPPSAKDKNAHRYLVQFVKEGSNTVARRVCFTCLSCSNHTASVKYFQFRKWDIYAYCEACHAKYKKSHCRTNPRSHLTSVSFEQTEDPTFEIPEASSGLSSDDDIHPHWQKPKKTTMTRGRSERVPDIERIPSQGDPLDPRIAENYYL